MPTTVGDIARQLTSELALNAGWLIAAEWVSDRYRQLAVRRFKHLRKFGELYVPATLSTGTVTATRDGTTIVGDAAAGAVWGTFVVGRAIRVRTNWYEIAGYDPATRTITLLPGTRFAEDSVVGGSYTIAPRYVPLNPSARWIDENIVSQRRRIVVAHMSRTELDAESPDRTRVGDVAFCWCEADVRPNADGQLCKTIELYPYCPTSEVYLYAWWPVPPTLGPDDPFPEQVDPHVVREGAMINAMRRKMSELLNKQPLTQEDVAAAATWRNEYRAQETRWEAIRGDAYLTDNTSDDKTFTLARGGYMTVDFDIRTAYDQVLAQWPR